MLLITQLTINIYKLDSYSVQLGWNNKNKINNAQYATLLYYYGVFRRIWWLPLRDTLTSAWSSFDRAKLQKLRLELIDANKYSVPVRPKKLPPVLHEFVNAEVTKLLKVGHISRSLITL